MWLKRRQFVGLGCSSYSSSLPGAMPHREACELDDKHYPSGGDAGLVGQEYRDGGERKLAAVVAGDFHGRFRDQP
jgi:hypothetical protein